jgi:hypothetical protein
VEDVHNDVEWDQSAISMSSVDSDHIDADIGEFGANTRDLIERNRDIQSSETSIEQTKAQLRSVQFYAEGLRASLRHIPRREQQSHTQALAAQLNAQLEMTTIKRQSILEAVAMQQHKLDEMVALQSKGEMRIVRSAGAFIRNCQREDPAGVDVTGSMKYSLRQLADCARDPRLVSGIHRGRCRGIHFENGPGSQIIMEPEFEARLQEENYKSHVKHFLDLVEPLHVEDIGLPPRDAAAIQRQKAEDETKATEAGRQGIIDRINAGISAIEDAYSEIKGVRDGYSQQRDLNILLYERDITGNEVEELAVPHGYDHFEWKHQRHLARVWENLRKAEAQHRDAVNEAVEAKVQHRYENLLGVTDHENDGFTESMGSAILNGAKVRCAGEILRIDRWLVGAHGRAYRAPSVPSDVADIETGSDVRCDVSTGGSPNDLLARWAAEVIVMRAEAERQRRETSNAAPVPAR